MPTSVPLVTLPKDRSFLEKRVYTVHAACLQAAAPSQVQAGSLRELAVEISSLRAKQGLLCPLAGNVNAGQTSERAQKPVDDSVVCLETHGRAVPEGKTAF